MRKNITCEDIQAIATCIEKNNLNNIDRKLRETATSLRDPTQVSVIENNKLKLAQLEIARAFIQKHPALIPDWRVSVLCFQDLYDFFIEAKEIENHETMAMLCWFLLLKREIRVKKSEEDEPVYTQQFIVLGETFFDEPTKFAAFIYWLLNNAVEPREIIHSNILHRYFALYVIHMDELHKTYQLLSEFGNSTEVFLNFIDEISCECPGLIDHPEGDEGFRSYNVKGAYFHHDHHFISFSRSRTDQPPLIDPKNVLSQGAHFFRLFGWKFMMSLNDIQSEECREIIYQIIDSPSSALFLNQYPIMVLSGVLNENTAIAIQNALLAWNQKVEGYDNYLIGLNPFYVHTVELPTSLNECICEALQRLFSEKCFQTNYHLPFLSVLCLKLEYMEAYQTEHNALLKMIFDFIFPIGHSLDDAVIQGIYNILPQIKVYFETAVTEFSQEVSEKIDDYLNNCCDYREVELTWGSHLSRFNFSKYYYPDLAEKTTYPHCKFQLKTRVLERFFANCESQQIPFSAMKFSKRICDDDEQQLRTLQEVVFFTKNDRLIEVIISQMLQCHNDFSGRFFHSSFGVDRSVIQHAFDHFNETKLLSFLKKIQYTEDQFFNVCKIAIFENIVAFCDLIKFELFTRELSFGCISYILENNMFDFLGELILKRLIDQPNPHPAICTFIYELFITAIEQDRIDFVRYLTRGEENRLLEQSAIKTGAEQAAQNCHCDILLYLCGFLDDIENTIIQKNNVPLLVETISIYKTQMLSSRDDFKKLLTIKNRNNETLLHLIVKYRSLKMLDAYCKLLKKALHRNEIGDFLNTRSTSGNLPYCEEDTTEAGQINDYLNEMCAFYVRKLSGAGLFYDQSCVNGSKRPREEPVDSDTLALLNL